MPRQLTATKTSHEKWIHIFFSLCRDYSNCLTLPNAGELFWSWISISHIQVHKEKENFVIACMFTSFTKCEVRHFHLVVVQWRQRNVQKVWCTCKVIVLPCQGVIKERLVPFVWKPGNSGENSNGTVHPGGNFPEKKQYLSRYYLLSVFTDTICTICLVNQCQACLVVVSTQAHLLSSVLQIVQLYALLW